MLLHELNELDNVALARIVQRGTAEIVEEAEDGLLLQDRSSIVWMLSAQDARLGATWLRRHADDDIELLMLVGDELVNEARKHLGFTRHMDCIQAVYLSSDPPSLKTMLSVRQAGTDDLAWVARHYDLADESELLDVIERELLFVGQIGGVNVGFVGEHQEGSMGLLHVLPEYRGRGFGADLECWMIADTLRRGQKPYCHVEANNAASLALQRKLGLTFSPRHVHWLG